MPAQHSQRPRDMTPQDHLEVLYTALSAYMESKGWNATYGTLRIESVGEDWGRARIGVHESAKTPEEVAAYRVANPHHAYRLIIPFNGHIQVQAKEEKDSV
jgi:hypothetical protein